MYSWYTIIVFDDISNDGACDTKIDDNEMMRCLEYTIIAITYNCK